MRKGLFITLEGPDGSGKSTQARLLAERLRSLGHGVVLTREPGGSPLAEKVRALLLDPSNQGLRGRAELLLFEAARNQHTLDTIEPALKAGKVVLSDRYHDSSTAYQAAGRGVGLSETAWLNRFATEGRRPHLTLVFDLDPAEGARRARQAKGGKDRMELTEGRFQARVRAAFLALARREPRRVKVLKVAGRTQAQVAEAAWALVAPRLRGKA